MKNTLYNRNSIFGSAMLGLLICSTLISWVGDSNHRFLEGSFAKNDTIIIKDTIVLEKSFFPKDTMLINETIVIEEIEYGCGYPREENATFQGVSSESFIKWVQENIIYSKDEIKDSIDKKAVIQFIVEKNGSLSKVEILRSSGSKKLDKSAIEVVKKSPNWEPAKTNGIPVRIRVQVPIYFKK